MAASCHQAEEVTGNPLTDRNNDIVDNSCSTVRAVFIQFNLLENTNI